jgi:hypothetical protein
VSLTEQPTYELTFDDFEKCIKFTKKDMDWCSQNNAKTKYGQAPDLATRFNNTLQGYLGEEALAKYFDYETVYKPYDKTAYDVLGYEVRTVSYDYAIMPTHHDDKPAMYVCVSFNKQTYVATLKGWSELSRCNARIKNWRDTWRFPCFGMPEIELWPMSTLPATPELIAHQKQVYA